jgi:spore coat polysaccharide biosynthesis protein SpsF (cytidylyltransferase family)
MESSRLPGKALMDIAGVTCVQRAVDRVLQVRTLTEFDLGRVVVAIPDTTENDVLESKLQERYGDLPWFDVFRGKADDVLDRYYQCALRHDADTVVRITADCPIIDPQVIEDAIAFHFRGGYDYTTNRPSYPDGMDVEVMTMAALTRCWEETRKIYQLACPPTLAALEIHMRSWLQQWREHVTTWLREIGAPDSSDGRVGEFNRGDMILDAEFPWLKVSVDTEEDRQRVEDIINTYGEEVGMDIIADVAEDYREQSI